MTPERIKELRSKYNPEFFAELSRDIPSDVDECLDYIDTLQRDVATYAQRDELVVGSMMVERDDAREEVKRLQSELARLKTLANLPPDYCLSCGGDGGHLEGCQGATGLMSVLTELNEANARISCLTIANEKLHKELAALRTPPRCPRCLSHIVGVGVVGSNVIEFVPHCFTCKLSASEVHRTPDAALNAWRPVPPPNPPPCSPRMGHILSVNNK